MCNLYSLSKGQAAIREIFDGIKDRAGNLQDLSEVYPDYNAPIVRRGFNGLELVQARWGLPSPQFALKGKKVDKGVTNVRNTKSPHWRRWLGPEHRCLVPFTAFSEPTRDAKGKYEPVWFALDEAKPIGFFVGIYVPGWTSVRKLKEGEVTADLYGFLTTEPNAEVAKFHPKAMPVILTTAEEREAWLNASWQDALLMQRSLADGTLLVL